ncbi:MAG: HAD-IIB family hydrolase [Candidatus Anammoxibacter sp.]
MTMRGKTVVITDLDGSLLHPRSYSFDEAKPSLELIKERNIPLILSSSKTRVEIELYREKLNNCHPFVAENGGGIFIPDDYFPFPIEGEKKDGYIVINLGTPYLEVRRIFKEVTDKEVADTKGFGDLTAKEVSEVTGMTLEEAILAKKREFDEPFTFNGSDEKKTQFLMAVEKRGFNWTEGRFLHILGNHDKGMAARILIGFFKQIFKNVTSVGLGDSLNDLPFLSEVDYPVLIPKEDGSYVSGEHIAGLIKAKTAGPNGWNNAVQNILEKI